MPSQKLQNIITQIDQQNTDNFGKFYLYVALLHKVTIDDDKTFVELIPALKSGVIDKLSGKPGKKLNVGQISPEVPVMVNRYSLLYKSKQYDPLASAQTILLAYIRKGKLADLITIIDKMYAHLSAVYAEGLNDDNRKIYGALRFNKKQPKIGLFLQEASLFNHHLLSIVDNVGTGAISSVASLVGLITLVASGVSAFPLLIGTTLMIGGGISAYICFSAAVELSEQINEKFQSIHDRLLEFPQDDSFFGSDKDHNAFVSSPLWPMANTIPTALESILFNDEQATMAAGIRNDLNYLAKSFS